MPKKSNLFRSIAIMLAVMLVCAISMQTGAWFRHEKQVSGVLVTSNGVKLLYNNLTTENSSYFLILSNNTNLEPMSTVSVTPVQVKKTAEDGYTDCYVRYKFNYYYSLDNGSSYTQTYLGDSDLHLSISALTNGTNFLKSVGEYTYYTTESSGTATLNTLQTLTKTTNNSNYINLFNTLTYLVDKDVPSDFKIKVEIVIDAIQATERARNALWSEDFNNDRVSLYFNTGASSMRATVGEQYGTLPTPTKAGYTFAGWSLLPEGYTQVEYIQSDGNQYVDSGLKLTNNSTVIMKFKFNDITPQSRVFGAQYPENDYLSFNAYINTYGYLAFNHGYNHTDVNSRVGIVITATNIYVNTSDIYKIEINRNGKIYVNDIEKLSSSPLPTGETGYTARIFAGVGSATNDTYRLKGRIYSSQFYESDILVRNFVPCINPLGEYGLYDTVTETFYGNNGTGAFTGGEATYITSTSTVTQDFTHKLYAHWMEN